MTRKEGKRREASQQPPPINFLEDRSSTCGPIWLPSLGRSCRRASEGRLAASGRPFLPALLHKPSRRRRAQNGWGRREHRAGPTCAPAPPLSPGPPGGLPQRSPCGQEFTERRLLCTRSRPTAGRRRLFLRAAPETPRQPREPPGLPSSGPARFWRLQARRPGLESLSRRRAAGPAAAAPARGPHLRGESGAARGLPGLSVAAARRLQPRLGLRLRPCPPRTPARSSSPPGLSAPSALGTSPASGAGCGLRRGRPATCHPIGPARAAQSSNAPCDWLASGRRGDRGGACRTWGEAAAADRGDLPPRPRPPRREQSVWRDRWAGRQRGNGGTRTQGPRR